MKSQYIFLIAVAYAHIINTMEDHAKLRRVALDALALAVELHIEKDNPESTIQALHCFSKDLGLRLGKKICPFIMPDPEKPTEYIHFYIGHFAIRSRNLMLFKVYLAHVDTLEVLDLADEMGQTVLEAIIHEMKTGYECGILSEMLFELSQLDNTQKIIVPAVITPQKTILGFDIKQ